MAPLLSGIGIENMTDAGEISCAQTHRARLPAGVQRHAIQTWGLALNGRRPNSLHFRMRRGIARLHHLVDAGGDDLSVLDEHGAKRAALVVADVLARELNS